MYIGSIAYAPLVNYGALNNAVQDFLYDNVMSRLELTIEQSGNIEALFGSHPIYGAALGIYYHAENYFMSGQKGQPNKMPRTGGHAGNSKTGNMSKIKPPVVKQKKSWIKWPVKKSGG